MRGGSYGDYYPPPLERMHKALQRYFKAEADEDPQQGQRTGGSSGNRPHFYRNKKTECIRTGEDRGFGKDKEYKIGMDP